MTKVAIVTGGNSVYDLILKKEIEDILQPNYEVTNCSLSPDSLKNCDIAVIVYNPKYTVFNDSIRYCFLGDHLEQFVWYNSNYKRFPARKTYKSPNCAGFARTEVELKMYLEYGK